jgi:hypothetical protein
MVGHLASFSITVLSFMGKPPCWAADVLAGQNFNRFSYQMQKDSKNILTHSIEMIELSGRISSSSSSSNGNIMVCFLCCTTSQIKIF